MPNIKRKEYTWYSFGPLYSYNAKINMVVGGRGIGKSYGKKKKCVNNWIKKDGEQFIYVRRFDKELKKAKRTFFADFAKEFPDWDFRVMGEEAQIAPAATRGTKKRQWETIGYFVALSTNQIEKSGSYPNVTTVMFDEFILEPGYLQYLPSEVDSLMSFFETVDRGQGKTKLYMLANSVSIVNPYFLEWRIRPDEFTGEFMVIGGGFVVVHFPNDEKFKKERAETDFGKFIAGTEYGNYAQENQFADNHRTMLDTKDGRARYRYTLETEDGLFSVWHNMFTREYFIQEKLPKDQTVFTLLIHKMGPDKVFLERNNKMLAQLRAGFNSGRASFDSPQTRNAFIQIFKR